MKAMISQPMRGRTDEEIKETRDAIKNILILHGIEVIDTVFVFENKNAVYYLAKSIEAMSEADVVIFTQGWEEARGCIIEHEIAKAYGKTIILLPSEKSL